MNGDIEELVLSGKLFNPPSRSSSPQRSRSPSPIPAQWPDADAEYEYDSDAERRRAIDSQVASHQQTQDSIGMGPGRTGVKGVIRDHAEAAAIARAKRAEEINELNRAMGKASLGGKTWAEEERERLMEKERLEGKAESLIEGRASRKGHFGHLMEVGVRSYVQAVEEDSSVWVLVHIYDPSLDRCASLDDTLSRLARIYPSTKFLRARAGAIGFATTKGSSARPSRLAPFPMTRRPSRQIVIPGRGGVDAEDDPYGDADVEEEDEDEEAEDGEGWEDDAVDTDVLPTLLAYRGGRLEHTWVRVDWEAKMGIEELLHRYRILRDAETRIAQHVPDLDGDELDDGELVFGGSDDET
ncbi:uncharacterized protein LAESUDRAFT_739800 [Laetiporus sulphureus 93-53]|uniref:Uncharacterized protein n=1 Tax=Laetiporus sulphureus 93-53 TaxID=1314785 RepID=A0A165AZS1_9APHY|nr:uncharacterized protein LAESUDRAFT_739800 [Laetiporus sulphureus 93-53]KZS99959.1 hypothetical protein LAESUDRAFT_739800 [Laetiporus sulphureus 93-53]